MGATGHAVACTSVTVLTPGHGWSRQCHCARHLSRSTGGRTREQPTDQAGHRLPGPLSPAAWQPVPCGSGLRGGWRSLPAARLPLLLSPLRPCPWAQLCLQANLCRAGSVPPSPKATGPCREQENKGSPGAVLLYVRATRGMRGKPALHLASAGALCTEQQPTSLRLQERVPAWAQGPGDILAQPLPWIEW